MNAEKIRAKRILARALELSVAQIPDDAGLGELLSWDSLGHIKVVVELEEEIGRPLQTEEVLSISDLASIGALLNQKA